MAYQADVDVTAQPIEAGSPYFADLIQAARTTSHDQIDGLLETLDTNKDSWARLEISERISLVDAVREELSAISDRWVSAEFEAKRIMPGTLGEAEERTILATVHRALRTLRGVLVEIRDYGRPLIPGPLTSGPNRQVVARVFPATTFDRILFPGVTSEVRMEPGTSVGEVLSTQASAYHQQQMEGKVALVLGAGNASVLPASDLLHKLFVELQVVILKFNPVNAYLGPLMEEAFRPLIKRGFLALVYGGAEEGAYLCSHPLVEELHLTGSDKTFEAIVFGRGSEGKARKRESRPLNSKRFTGELGNVSPVIVVPGPWRPKDLKEQAKHIATWLVANGGFACLTPRVIVQHKTWSLRDDLMDEVGRILERYPTRYAYYPGAEERHDEFLQGHKDACRYGDAENSHLPWTIIRNVDPDETNDICFKREAFCSLTAETALEAPGAAAFIERAVEFANDTLWGTLCATIIVHPKSLADPVVGRAVEDAISGLRYGTVSLNMLAYYSAYFMTAPWGAYPGSTIYDIQSGTGKTFNLLMFSRPQKSVTRAPFKRLDPLTVESTRAAEFGKKLANFEANPSWRSLPGLVLTALRS